jgi:hypothetical protein
VFDLILFLQRVLLYSERASLDHVSTGVEPNRFIRVSTHKSIEDLIATQIAAEKQATSIGQVQSKPPSKQPAVQQPSAPIAPVELATADELEDDEPEVASVAASAAASKPSKSKEKKIKKKNEPEADIDLDELLATMNIRPGLCAWAVCKKPVKLVGMDCPHCHVHCLISHHLFQPSVDLLSDRLASALNMAWPKSTVVAPTPNVLRALISKSRSTLHHFDMFFMFTCSHFSVVCVCVVRLHCKVAPPTSIPTSALSCIVNLRNKYPSLHCYHILRFSSDYVLVQIDEKASGRQVKKDDKKK